MKLLFDQNLAPSLPIRLDEPFPSSCHLDPLGLGCAGDEVIWEYAHDHVLTIDADFNQLSVLRGWPPKVIWLQIGNCTTDEVEALLRAHAAVITTFGNDEMAGTLVLG